MPFSGSDVEHRTRARKKSFPMLLAAAADAIGSSRLETLAILTDVDQVSTLFSSLDDMRKGHVVNMNEAFKDL